MSEVILRKTNIAGRPCLVPVDDEGSDLLHKLKDGRDVGCTVKQHRNLRHLRLFFAILRFVQMHSPVMEGVPIEKLKTSLKIATGLCDTFIDCETGKLAYVPRSISIAAMDQSEFAPWFDDACRMVATRWMPEGVTPEDVRRELLLMVDGPHALQEQRA